MPNKLSLVIMSLSKKNKPILIVYESQLKGLVLSQLLIRNSYASQLRI